MRYEAVQFRPFGPWHAVRPEDDHTTICGKRVLSAIRMWEDWDTSTVYRCARCELGVLKRHSEEQNRSSEAD